MELAIGVCVFGHGGRGVDTAVSRARISVHMDDGGLFSGPMAHRSFRALTEEEPAEEAPRDAPVEALIIGQKYKARTTAINRGVRVYYDVTFVAARASVEQFVRGTAVDQDRVFIVDPLGHGIVPALYVTGSIVEMSL